MFKRSLCALALVVVCSAQTPAIAQGYALKETPDGALVRWDAGAVRLWVAADPACGPTDEELRAAAAEAARAWNATSTAPRLVIGVGEPPATIGYDPREADGNGIYVICDEWTRGDRLAVTISWHDELRGELLDTDILIDGRAPLSATSPTPSNTYDLTSVLTHEMGHVLGLDESDHPAATMNTLAVLGDDGRRTLHEDDVAAVRALYSGAFSSGTASCSTGVGDPPGATPSGLVLAIALLVFVRRRSRRRATSARSTRAPGRDPS